MDLREWLVLHIRHKDVFARKLQEVEETPSGATFKFKDRVLTGVVMDVLSEPDVQGETIIATLNTPENVEYLIAHWDAFVDPGLTVVFANPSLNEKWALKPALHARIHDGDIEQGIRSLASSVPFV